MILVLLDLGSRIGCLAGVGLSENMINWHYLYAADIGTIFCMLIDVF